MSESPSARPPFTPANWPSWLLVVVLWLLGKSPQFVGIHLSRPLGWLMFRVMKRRRKIAVRNIERCFPQYSKAEREALIREFFRSLARAVFEFAWSWSASDRRFRNMVSLEGRDNLEAAHSLGKGVLVISAHITCLEIGGRIFGQVAEASGLYRPLKNPVLEWYQNRARSKYPCHMISKKDVRIAIRLLRKGGLLWTAPDQDFGPGQSSFAPFFRIQTATLLAPRRMAELTGCAVVAMYLVYDAKTRKYKQKISPPLEDFPSEDLLHDLTRINEIMETQISLAPAQYWWIHRRFKTRPDGEPPFYE
jgi:KDO2-lipid IV(A) lauroyltransferase